MKKKNRGLAYTAVGFLASFGVWTALLRRVDVLPIGPMESRVGFAAFNRFLHNVTGVHWGLYILTDWLGLVPLAVIFGFALLGLWQWITRKSLRRVDRSILLLGGFYLAVMAAYVLFEIVAINYRPVLINGCLEVSYPSSTTTLVTCVMPTAMMQLRARVKNGVLRRCILLALAAFTVFMAVCRLLSGVHWVTDIIGGALLSAGLVTAYAWLALGNGKSV